MGYCIIALFPDIDFPECKFFGALEVVFTDPETGTDVVKEFASVLSVPIIPAIIPSEELTYSRMKYSPGSGIEIWLRFDACPRSQ